MIVSLHSEPKILVQEIGRQNISGNFQKVLKQYYKLLTKYYVKTKFFDIST